MKNKILLVLLIVIIFPFLYYITDWGLKMTIFSYLVLFGMGFGAYKYLTNV